MRGAFRRGLGSLPEIILKLAPKISKSPIAILGGTGKLGKGLVFRFAAAGYPVIIGSRDLEKAAVVTDQILTINPAAVITAEDHRTAIINCDIVICSVPYSAHFDLLSEFKVELAGKLIIDAVVPFNPASKGVYETPKFGSAALEAKQILGEQARVVDAFQHISAKKMNRSDQNGGDVLVCGSPIDARNEVIGLVNEIGFHAVDAGPIENSVIVEGITPLLIHMNKTYKKTGLSVRIEGL